MDIYKLLVLQYIAHFLSDFIFQSPKWSENKDKYSFKSKYLYRHISVIFLVSAVLSFTGYFVLFSLIIAGIHLVIDGFKKSIKESKLFGKVYFFLDQILHLITITGIVYFYNSLVLIDFYLELPDLQYIIYVFAFLLILKPSNILIREIFLFYEIKLDAEDYKNDELPNAGKLIGIIERILALTLIILGEFAAIGFILAAKSILRFKDAQAQKAEYVLIGTMLSFGIAIIIGVVFLLIIKMI